MMKSRATVLSWGILRHGMNRNADNKCEDTTGACNPSYPLHSVPLS